MLLIAQNSCFDIKAVLQKMDDNLQLNTRYFLSRMIVFRRFNTILILLQVIKQFKLNDF